MTGTATSDPEKQPSVEVVSPPDVPDVQDVPETPEGPLSAAASRALDRVFRNIDGTTAPEELAAIGVAGDARTAWLLSDLIRFTTNADVVGPAIDAMNLLTGGGFDLNDPWIGPTNQLIAWDLPTFPEYRQYKKDLYTLVDPRWDFVFAEPTEIDFRLLSWGGVLIDDRPLGDPEPCRTGCIPALDHPKVTPAAEGDWYPDSGYVFGVEIGGSARAYPRNIMEVHEMVNDRLGGRDFALPYCTLCASAQLWFTDNVEGFEEPVFRTSGLLSRSNKVMYELGTRSVFDTFTGRALSGPMLAAAVQLDEGTVVTTTWGEWKAQHPDTTIVAEDGGIGRSYELDPLGGRDDNGPIFPIGDVDSRLSVQERVLGVIASSGEAVAFSVAGARDVIGSGGHVEMAGITVTVDGGGLVAAEAGGRTLASHEAYWFAWSQFHPDTLLWQDE